LKLLEQITNMSTFLLAAWIRWFPPMAKRSPSPLIITGLRSGLERLTPVAKGIALPWVVWKASVFT
jgi:hypothetical protein